MAHAIEIGTPAWADRLRQADEGRGILRGLKPWTSEQLRWTEQNLNRTLPVGMGLFLLEFGSGEFGTSGWSIYSSRQFVDACVGPLWVLTDVPPTASLDELRQYYVSRGEGSTLQLATATPELNVLDLVQFGTDGGGGYHLVDVVAHERYYELYLSTMTPVATTFSEWLHHALQEIDLRFGP